MKSRLLLVQAALVALALAMVATSAQAVATDYLFGFGSHGSGDGQFQSPTEISIGPGGFVYVLDHGNQRLQKFDADGHFLAKWNSARSFLGAMTSLAATSDGRVWVQTGGSIVKYDADGTYLLWSGSLAGSSAQSHHLTEDRAGNFYEKSWLNGASQVQRFLSTPGFSAPTSAGSFFSGTGALGRIAVRPNGEIFATDIHPVTHVPFMARRSATNVILGQWPYAGIVLNSTCDGLGNLYVCEQGSDAVQVFDEVGTLLAGFGGSGAAPGQFTGPSDVAVGADGRIYVVDRGNHRVQVFGNGATPAAATTWGRVKADYR